VVRSRHRIYRNGRRSRVTAFTGFGVVVLLVLAAVTAMALRHGGGAAGALPAATDPTVASDPASPSPSQSVSPSASPSPSPSRSPSPSATPGAAGTRLLFGIGTEADSARRTKLAQQAPVRMLTSWYNGPNDLSWMAGWRGGTVPQSYAAGYALHLIVWTGDSEGQVSTSYGTACGRGYPLSGRFLGDMQQLAQIFAGTAAGPPLYVTLFTEFQTYPCADNAWSPNTATTNYYRALQDKYRAAYALFHRYAPNARVSIGWGGWQANYDSPGDGGGRSLFGYFDGIMRMSDFQSFQAMADQSNAPIIRNMVGILGRYGPVMLAHYKPNSGSQSTFDKDVREVFTDAFLAPQIRAGLFAVSFMDNENLSASSSTFTLVKTAVTKYGRGW
jgi:hypothetical protein